MGILTIPPDMQAVFNQITEKTELRDAQGRMIGVFTPPAIADAELYERVKAKIDPELIKQRKQEQGSVPYEEVKKRLQALESGG